jgi:DNA repair exonuclease SbcCD ATPase subunit
MQIELLEKRMVGTEIAEPAKKKEQSEYVTFLETQLQNEQKNMGDAQVILGRYQGDIVHEDAELTASAAEISRITQVVDELEKTHSELKTELSGTVKPSVMKTKPLLAQRAAAATKVEASSPSKREQTIHNTRHEESSPKVHTRMVESEAFEELEKKLQRALAKEKEQAEYATFMETELEEAQCTATEAASALAALEEERERINDELVHTRAAYHDNSQNAQVEFEQANFRIKTLEKENVLLRERIKNLTELQESLMNQIQLSGSDVRLQGADSSMGIDNKFLCELSLLKDQIRLLEESKDVLERQLAKSRSALEKSEAKLIETKSLANEADLEAAQVREMAMNALQERTLASVALDNALRESERLRADLNELKVKSKSIGALYESENARKSAEQDLERTREEVAQTRERIDELEHQVSDLRSDKLESLAYGTLLETQLSSAKSSSLFVHHFLSEEADTEVKVVIIHVTIWQLCASVSTG